MAWERIVAISWTGRATLRRLQWQRANGGADTMLIWLGKQMLGQKDKVETEAINTHHVSGAFVLGKGDPAEIDLSPDYRWNAGR